MGKIKQGILGGVSGTVGTVVGGSWKGISYLRGKNEHFTDANSVKQQKHRAKFGACVALARSIMDTIIRPIWNKAADKMSGYNLFVKTNLAVFNAEGEISDHQNLQVSIGEVVLPPDLVIEDDDAVEGGIKMSWTDNTGFAFAEADDKLQLLILCGEEVFVPQDLDIDRSAAAANILLPFGAGVEAHIYAFFKNEENGTFSADQYGHVNIT